MKILHVNKFLYRRGGAEAYLEDLSELQRGAGHEVAFFGMDHPDNPPHRYAAHFPRRVELEPAPGGVLDRARAAGRMLWSTSAARGLDAVLEDFRPDVAHLHNVYHHLSPSILRPLARRRVPTVMTLHDYKLACPTYRFLAHGQPCEACLGGRFQQAVRRRCKDGSLAASALLAAELSVHTLLRAYAPVQVFVCPSRFMAAKMAEAGVFPDRLRHVPHFCDTSGVALDDRPGSGVVSAGRLSPEKGLDVLLEAVAWLGPDARLEVVGDGPERAWLERLAHERAPGRVRFHGRVPRDRVLELVRSAAVAAVPSRWYENQPMAVLEAFACGVPVVGTRLGGIPELVEAGVDGALVPPDDPAALTHALESFLGNPGGARAMGRAGRAKVERDFSPGRHLAALEEVYAEADRRILQEA